MPKSYINLVRQLVVCTEDSVERLLIDSIGKSPWEVRTVGEHNTSHSLASLDMDSA
jgi:hypothetical protein